MDVTLNEIREKTYKKRDAWWTVLLVDPIASRLVRLVAPHRRITPNVLTLIATTIGLFAAVCFAQQTRGWLIAGALVFHVSFIVDCMDGKIARLNGTGSVFGGWLDMVLDRVRVFACALALFGGQYLATERIIYLWLLAVAIFVDMFRYLNASQMGKVRAEMKDKVAEVLRPMREAQAAAEAAAESEDAEDDESPEEEETVPVQRKSLKREAGGWLRRHRIRTHVFSGVEYEMTLFIVAPITGWLIPLTIPAVFLLVIFEAWLVSKLWRQTRAFPAKLAAAEAQAAEFAAESGGAVLIAYAKHPN